MSRSLPFPERQSTRPLRILHFTLAPSFDLKFLFHPLLNDAQAGVNYFSVGQSGFAHDRVPLRGQLRELLRAWRLLWEGWGSDNRRSIAFCHTTKFALLPLLMCRLLGVGQVIYFNHGVPYLGHRGPVRWGLWMLERANMAAAHRVITVSPSMARVLRPSDADSPWRYSTYPGSSSGLREADYVSPSAVRLGRRTRTRPGVRYLYAGRLQSRKGIFLLLDAWQAHSVHFSDDELWLCGFDAEQLAATGLELGSLPRVVVKGYVVKMAAVYAEVDIVISPSFHEGFGYTLLEGAARGCGIVSSAIPGPDVMFTPRMQRLLFPAGDAAKLAEIMSVLSASPRALALAKCLSYCSARRFEMHRLTYPHASPAKL
jgi:glycosyltransferase involved in cell wall biosynthesis